MCVDESNDCRREKGLIKISFDEWGKLVKILEISVDDIYEPDENNVYIYNNNASGNLQGINIYSVPEYMLEIQKKYDR